MAGCICQSALLDRFVPSVPSVGSSCPVRSGLLLARPRRRRPRVWCGVGLSCFTRPLAASCHDRTPYLYLVYTLPLIPCSLRVRSIPAAPPVRAFCRPALSRSSPHPSALFLPCLRPSEGVPARSVCQNRLQRRLEAVLYPPHRLCED